MDKDQKNQEKQYTTDWKPRRVKPVVNTSALNAKDKAKQYLNAGTADQLLVPFIQESKTEGLITDTDGNEYVDCICAWGAEPWGSQHPEIRKAMIEAWYQHGAQISCSILSTPVLGLAQKLVSLSPENITRAEFSVTGTQAVESAVRLMRSVTGKSVILVFGPVYHGESTTLTAAMSSDSTHVSKGVHALAPGIIHVPYPSQSKSPFRKNEKGNSEDILTYLDWITRYQIDVDQIAGVVIEPVTTEGGVYTPDQYFWDNLQKKCKENNWLLCIDEVQTGMGRCGEILAINLWENIQPDLIILGKGISGGGMPISAVLGSEKVMGNSTISQGSTFGWQPAACAAALASINILTKPETLHYVKFMGEKAKQILNPLIGEGKAKAVRAVGAEIAVEYEHFRENGTNRTIFLENYLLENGVVAMWDESKPFIRLQPALNLHPVLWEYALQTLAQGLRES